MERYLLRLQPSPLKGCNALHLKDYETPHALPLDQIQQTIQDNKAAALNAIEVGFDGVELHAANGYLPNQFLSDNANQRTEAYGGSIENRSRFVIEVY